MMPSTVTTTQVNYRKGTAFELDDGPAIGVGSFRIDEDRLPTGLRGSGDQTTSSFPAAFFGLTIDSQNLEWKMLDEIQLEDL